MRHYVKIATATTGFDCIRELLKFNGCILWSKIKNAGDSELCYMIEFEYEGELYPIIEYLEHEFPTAKVSKGEIPNNEYFLSRMGSYEEQCDKMGWECEPTLVD